MAALLSSSSTIIISSKSINTTRYPSHQTHNNISFKHYLRPSAIKFCNTLLNHQKNRGVNIISRAGPSSTQYIFAFVFPLSLLAFTIFTAFRIGHKLDQKFLEELAMNEAIREAEEENDDATEPVILKKEEPALPRARNRPRREI